MEELPELAAAAAAAHQMADEEGSRKKRQVKDLDNVAGEMDVSTEISALDIDDKVTIYDCL